MTAAQEKHCANCFDHVSVLAGEICGTCSVRGCNSDTCPFRENGVPHAQPTNAVHPVHDEVIQIKPFNDTSEWFNVKVDVDTVLVPGHTFLAVKTIDFDLNSPHYFFKRGFVPAQTAWRKLQ